MKPQKFLIVDAMNLILRCAFTTKSNDNFEKIGMSFHIMFQSIAKTHSLFKTDHVVVAFDGGSWRKEFYKRYKANRITDAAKKPVSHKIFMEELMKAKDDLRTYLTDKTNVTVLHDTLLEADDLIAAWIFCHENNDHVILSSDTDFKQLVTNNVTLYDAINDRYYTHEGLFGIDGLLKTDKVGNLVDSDCAEYSLFKKIIRGDSSDNIKPAYPGVREHGTKGKIGIAEAYKDRHTQGYAWNNFMNQVWTSETGEDILVSDAYKLNEMLIDLTKQPDNIKDKMAQTVFNVYNNHKKVPAIGAWFLKFCGKYDLIQLSKNSTNIVKTLAAPLHINKEEENESDIVQG